MSDQQQVMDTEAAFGTGKKTLKAYIVGFSLCLIITIIAFVIVGRHMMSVPHLYITVTLLALAQLYVQVVFFLRLNGSKEGRWNVMSFAFTLFIILIIVGGSLWIMYNLNYYMTR